MQPMVVEANDHHRVMLLLHLPNKTKASEYIKVVVTTTSRSCQETEHRHWPHWPHVAIE